MADTIVCGACCLSVSHLLLQFIFLEKSVLRKSGISSRLMTMASGFKSKLNNMTYMTFRLAISYNTGRTQHSSLSNILLHLNLKIKIKYLINRSYALCFVFSGSAPKFAINKYRQGSLMIVLIGDGSCIIIY